MRARGFNEAGAASPRKLVYQAEYNLLIRPLQ